MSRWTHAICQECWNRREPNRKPTRLVIPSPQACCFCGGITTSGIYVRDDPVLTRCGGDHSYDS